MEPFIGQIQAFPYTFEPRYWALCDGRLMSIAQNQTLFSLLGNQFGGDGRSTFALPKLDDVSEGVKYYIALEGLYPSRN